MRAVVEADLADLIEVDSRLQDGDKEWDQAAGEDLVRRTSLQMRRLLVDGLLQRYRRATGLRGEVRLNVQPAPVANGAKFSVTGGAQTSSGLVSGIVMYDRALSDEEIEELARKATVQGGVPDTLRQSQWLSSVCLEVGSVKVQRRDVVKYVANKLGGVHYDSHRKPEEDSVYLALDEMKSTSFIGLRTPYFQLLSLMQEFIESPDVRAVLDP